MIKKCGGQKLEVKVETVGGGGTLINFIGKGTAYCDRVGRTATAVNYYMPHGKWERRKSEHNLMMDATNGLCRECKRMGWLNDN